MPLPTTIEEVLSRLDAIIADAQAKGKRTGYFASHGKIPKKSSTSSTPTRKKSCKRTLCRHK